MNDRSTSARFAPRPPGSIPANLSIDLRKRGDLRFVLRAVVNGWPVPEQIRKAICDQLTPALEAAEGNAKRTILIAKLALRMEASSMIAEGFQPSLFPYLRRRRPERRKPRRFRREHKT